MHEQNSQENKQALQVRERKWQQIKSNKTISSSSEIPSLTKNRHRLKITG